MKIPIIFLCLFLLSMIAFPFLLALEDNKSDVNLIVEFYQNGNVVKKWNTNYVVNSDNNHYFKDNLTNNDIMVCGDVVITEITEIKENHD